MPPTSREELSVDKLLDSELLESDSDEPDSVLPQLGVDGTHVLGPQPAEHSSEPAQEGHHCRLVGPQRAQRHRLRHGRSGGSLVKGW